MIILYQDEAVVEVEPEDGGAHAAVLGDGRGHVVAHDLRQARAGVGVEGRAELPAGGREGEEKRKEEATPACERLHDLYAR